EAVDGELRQGRDQHDGRKQAERGERSDEVEHVAQVSRAERRIDDAQRVRERRLDDSAYRAAYLAVAPVEVRLPGRMEVRDHDTDGDHGPGEAGDRDDEACGEAAPRDRVPDPEAGDDEPDLLLTKGGRDSAERERYEAIVVEVTKRE